MQRMTNGFNRNNIIRWVTIGSYCCMVRQIKDENIEKISKDFAKGQISFLDLQRVIS